MSFAVKYGDLFAHPAEALAHGVNCVGVVGGLASAMADRFPDAMTQYVLAARSGEISPGGVLFTRDRTGQVILHCASQDQPGADATEEWLQQSLTAALATAQTERISSVAVPLIGGGIGGLDPDRAEQVIAEVSEASPVAVTLVLPK